MDKTATIQSYATCYTRFTASDTRLPTAKNAIGMPLILRRISQIITALSVVLAALLVQGQIQLWWLFHPHLPLKDTWHVLPLVHQVLTDGWLSVSAANWLEPHASAHRVAFTRLLMALDYRWFAGQNHLLYACTGLSLGWLWLAYMRAFRGSGASGNTQCCFQAALILIFLLAPGQFFNLINPINQSWFMALALSVAALLCALRGGSLSLGLACLIGTLAAFTNFSGALVLLLLPVAAVLADSPRRRVVPVALYCLVFLAVYQHGMQSGFGVLLEYRAQHPDKFPDGLSALLLVCAQAMFLGTLKYLGSPLSTHWLWPAGALVAVSMVFLCNRLYAALTRSGPKNPGEMSAILVACLCAGTALATQFGRLLFDSPDALRYQTVVMLYWLSICCLAYYRLTPARAQAVSVLLVVAIVLLPLQRDASGGAHALNAGLRSETLARLGLADQSRYRAALPRKVVTDPLAVHGPWLRDRQLAFAADGSTDDDHETGPWTRRVSQKMDDGSSAELRPQLTVPATLYSVVLERELTRKWISR